MLVSNDPFPGLSDFLPNFLLEGIEPQEPSEIINFPTIDDENRISWLVVLVNWYFGYLPDDFHSIDDLPEDDILPVQVRTRFQGNVELRGVRIASTVRHRQQS